jgi:hypothetical protein
MSQHLLPAHPSSALAPSICAQTAGSELWAQEINIIRRAIPLWPSTGKDAEHAAKIDHSEHIPAQIAQVTATLRVQESLGVPAEPLGSSGRLLSRAPVSM